MNSVILLAALVMTPELAPEPVQFDTHTIELELQAEIDAQVAEVELNLNSMETEQPVLVADHADSQDAE